MQNLEPGIRKGEQGSHQPLQRLHSTGNLPTLVPPDLRFLHPFSRPISFLHLAQLRTLRYLSNLEACARYLASFKIYTYSAAMEH